MMSETPAWHGVLVANPVIMSDTLEIDFDAYGGHVAWLAAEGCDGITPNGSLGEYQTLTAEERARVVATAFEAAPDGVRGDPGGRRLRFTRIGPLGRAGGRSWGARGNGAAAQRLPRRRPTPCSSTTGRSPRSGCR